MPVHSNGGIDLCRRKFDEYVSYTQHNTNKFKIDFFPSLASSLFLCVIRENVQIKLSYFVNNIFFGICLFIVNKFRNRV